MTRTRMLAKAIAWGLPLLALSGWGQIPATRPGMNAMRPMVRRNFASAPKSVSATPVVTAAPQAPPTLSQLPATPPQVSYQNGMLTIVAQNSTLGDILREVHRTTGASIEVPPNATERVVGRMGPGPATDVLASLLNGSSFNYVLLGSETDPTRLASVMLTMKTGGADTGPVEPQQRPYYLVNPGANAGGMNSGVMAPGAGPGGPVAQPAPAGDDEADAEEEKDEDTADEDQAQDQGQGQGAAVQSPEGAQPNAGPKTPEQILEMLRQRPGQVQPGQPIPPIPQQNNNEDNN